MLFIVYVIRFCSIIDTKYCLERDKMILKRNKLHSTYQSIYVVVKNTYMWFGRKTKQM